jgi:hypothetical protein
LQKAVQPEKLRYFDLLESVYDTGEFLSYPRRWHEEVDVGAGAELDFVVLALLLVLGLIAETLEGVVPVQDKS